MFESNADLSFFGQYRKLNETDKKRFSKVSNKILNKTFIIKIKPEDQTDYYFLVSNLKMFQAYFSLIEYQVLHYDIDSIVMLQNIANRNRLQFKKIETVFLLVIASIYSDKMKESSLMNKIFTTVREVNDDVNKTSIYKETINKTIMKSTLNLLRKFSIIDYDSEKSLDYSDTKIQIYPSVLRVINVDNIDNLITVIESYKLGGDTDEDTDENPID